MKIVVVGGGISGVCCAEELCRLGPGHEITLVSASSTLKEVKNVTPLSSHIEEFEVVEKDLTSLQYESLTVVQGVATSVDTQEKNLILQSGDRLSYDKLCICSGARPKTLSSSSHVLVLRDLESVQTLQKRLERAKKVLVAGNGGISLEVMQALRGVEIIWALKHSHIGDAFFDADAAQFLLEELKSSFWQEHQQQEVGEYTHDKPLQDDDAECHEKQTFKSEAHKEQEKCNVIQPPGHAVGPKWVENLHAVGLPPSVKLEKNCTISSLEEINQLSGEPSIKVKLSNGTCVEVDFVICAIGVDPATDWVPDNVMKAADGGVEVNAAMQSSVPGIYAAGDACTYTSDSPHWFQMRLWTQAKLMGTYAAHCMLGLADEYATGFNFELFTHVTRFCGKKVVFLGLYNGQNLENKSKNLIAYIRSTPGISASFVRVILFEGRMQGAVLIGETELEEAFQNLILDQLDLTSYGEAILDPDMGIDHVFD